MAHPINDVINWIEGRKTIPCNDQCRYWKFPHLETACVLSDVFSVKKGKLCFESEPKSPNNRIEQTPGSAAHPER